MKKAKITLVKSVIGNKRSLRDVVTSLGLKKLNSSVVHTLTPGILGKINKVSHLVKVEEAKWIYIV